MHVCLKPLAFAVVLAVCLVRGVGSTRRCWRSGSGQEPVWRRPRPLEQPGARLQTAQGGLSGGYPEASGASKSLPEGCQKAVWRSGGRLAGVWAAHQAVWRRPRVSGATRSASGAARSASGGGPRRPDWRPSGSVWGVLAAGSGASRPPGRRLGGLAKAARASGAARKTAGRPPEARNEFPLQEAPRQSKRLQEAPNAPKPRTETLV